MGKAVVPILTPSFPFSSTKVSGESKIILTKVPFRRFLKKISTLSTSHMPCFLCAHIKKHHSSTQTNRKTPNIQTISTQTKHRPHKHRACRGNSQLHIQNHRRTIRTKYIHCHMQHTGQHRSKSTPNKNQSHSTNRLPQKRKTQQSDKHHKSPNTHHLRIHKTPSHKSPNQAAQSNTDKQYTDKSCRPPHHT